jgi:SAM-dependent methyltransferase
MAERDWNARYAAGELPWDTGIPDENLVELVTAGVVSPARTLEIGCGTGTNALWLSGRGFDVLGIDLAPLAIDRARAKTSACRFEVRDIFDPGLDERFDFVFDRGCFHVFDEDAVRERFAARVAALLLPGGRWLSLIGSTEGPPRDTGPPRRSARQIVAAIEPELELVELRAANFDAHTETPLPAWRCLSRKRAMPAQPPTVR